MPNWERVPILGDNPVFCFEARRLWTKRTVRWLVLLTVVVALVGWVAEWRFQGALSGVRSRGALSVLGGLFWGVAPPSLSLFRSVSGPGVWRGNWGPYSQAPYLAMGLLCWMGQAGGKYFVPVLAAMSLTDDRSSGRLGPLLASAMPVPTILIGKLMAPLLPFCLLVGVGMLVFGPIAALGGALDPAIVIWPVIPAVLSMLVAGMAGLWVGASVRHPGTGVALSLLLVLIVLPFIRGLFGYVVYLLVQPIMPQPGPVPPWFFVLIAVPGMALEAALLAALWYTTTRALSRGGE